MNFFFRNKSVSFTFLDMCGMALGATSFNYLYREATKDSKMKKETNKVSF
jgi:hypothetical protein